MYWIDPQPAQSQRTNLTVLFDKCSIQLEPEQDAMLEQLSHFQNSMGHAGISLDFHRLNVMTTLSAEFEKYKAAGSKALWQMTRGSSHFRIWCRFNSNSAAHQVPNLKKWQVEDPEGALAFQTS